MEKDKKNLLVFADWLCVEGSPSKLSYAIYSFAFTFTSCLCGAWRSGREGTLGSSHISSEPISSSAHVCVLLDSSMDTGTFKKPLFPFPNFFLPKLPKLPIACLDFSHSAMVNTIMFRNSANAIQEVALVPGMLQVMLNKAKPFHQYFWKPPDRLKTFP